MEDPAWGIVFVIYAVYIWRIHRDLVKYIVIVVLIYGGSVMRLQLSNIESSGQYHVKVLKVNHKDTYIMIEGIYKMKSVNVYLSGRDDILIGSTYKFTGELEHPESATVPNTFDYRQYLLSKNVKYTIRATEYKYVKSGVSLSMITGKVNQYIEKRFPYSSPYIKTFILADKSDIDQYMIEQIRMLGISHMFAVSGYHVGLLVIAIKFILSKGNVSEKNIDKINMVILLLYMIITGFTASIVRASLMYIGLVLKRWLNWRISALDILAVIFILLLWIRPYQYYNVGFVLSFYITMVLILSQRILAKRNSRESVAIVSILAFLASFPIVFNLNNQINLLTIIYNIMIIYIMTVVLLPLTYLTFVLPVLDKPLYIVNIIFESIMDSLSRIDHLVIYGNITSIWVYIIIVITIYFIARQFELNRSIGVPLVLFVLLVSLSLYSNRLDPRQQIVFLDVYGDATLIKDRFDSCNILIDTGEMDQYDTVIDFIQSKNIKRIDYLIISHFHSDHYGEANDIRQSFDIVHLVTANTVESYENHSILCGSIEMYVFPMSYDSENENNNSILLEVIIAERSYLFVGDAEVKREEEFLDRYDMSVDYLKVGHHGSITSSSEAFLDRLSPREVFIMVPRNNRHGHPHDAVIERFSIRDIVVHRTDIHGTIEVTYWLGKERKKYHRP